MTGDVLKADVLTSAFSAYSFISRNYIEKDNQ